MATETKNPHVRTSRITLLVLLTTSIGLAGPIAINIHELTHVLCAVKGECFGEVKWLEGISALPIWNLLFGTWAAVLLILSTLGHHFVWPTLVTVLQNSQPTHGTSTRPSLAELKKTSRLCMIFSFLLWLAMLVAALWYYLNANA